LEFRKIKGSKFLSTFLIALAMTVSACSFSYDPVEEFCSGWKSNKYEQASKSIRSSINYMRSNSNVSVYGGPGFTYGTFVEFYDILLDDQAGFADRKQAIELITSICESHTMTKRGA